MPNLIPRDGRGPLVGFIFFLVLLFLMEGAAYLCPAKHNRLDRIRGLLSQHSELFWRQRAGLKTEFEGAQVRTNALGLRHGPVRKKKDRPVLRIVTLGASPTFGWGVEREKTYANVLETILKDTLNTEQVEVINGGQIGYSSHQGRRFFEDVILPLKPNMITVSYVINDVDKYRFYRNHSAPDSGLKPKNGLLIAIENALEHSRFFRLYRKFLNGSRSASQQFFGERGTGEYRQARRVTTEEYRANITAIIDLARQHDIDVVLVKMPVNLPGGVKVPASNVVRAGQTVTEARAWAERGYRREAIQLLQQALAYNPNTAEAHYYLGQLYQKQGKRKKARRHFEQTVVLELYECAQLATAYHRVLDEIAAQRDVRMVDVVTAFAQFSRHDGGYLFLDPEHDTIHPNPMGHAVIGWAIYDEIFARP